MTTFAGQFCNVKASGVAVSTTGEATTDVGGLHTTYQITNAAHQVLDRAVAVTVKKNGATQSPTLYTLDRLFGRVTFLSALVGTDVVTIDGSYLPMTTVAEATGAQMTHSQNPLDSTTFASAGWIERSAGLQDAQGTVDRFYADDALFYTVLAAGTVMVVEFWRDATHVDWRAWALFQKMDGKASPTTIVGESVTWSGTPDADGRVVSYA
jgi:hypothetical protein